MPAVQKYRKAWEQLPELCDWLCEIPEEPVRAYCNVCKIKLQAHKSSLLDHKKTARHMYGEQKQQDPFQISQSDPLNTSHIIDTFPDGIHHYIDDPKDHTGLSSIKKELPPQLQVAQRASLIWKHFTKLNKTDSSCNICNRVYKSSGNTTNLRKHLQYNHHDVYKTILNTREEAFNMWIAEKKKTGWNKHDYGLDLFGKCVAAQMKKLPEEQAIKLTIEIQKLIGEARLQEIQEQKIEPSINIEEKDFQVQYVNEDEKLHSSNIEMQANDFHVQYVNQDYVNGGQIVIVSNEQQ